ncbi:MAG: SDR family oxidoreductase [Bacteroidota bacterium]
MSQKIFITGASGGFGSLTVKALLAEGHQVVGSMRSVSGKNEEVAKELSAAGAQLVEMDVTGDESVEQGVAKAIELLGGLDIVINNAGVGVIGMVEHFTPDDLKYLFDVNVFGVQRVNRAVLPFLRKQGNGSLIHVSSLLGRITLPFYGPYNASKWALEALVENYRVELSGFGIESLIVEPGGYPTTFMVNLLQPSDTSRVEDYGEFMQVPAAMGENFGAALANNPEQKPEKVAEAIRDLVNMNRGERPFRTVVDSMGMGDHVKGYNTQLDQITHGIYSAFGMEGMLNLK